MLDRYSNTPVVSQFLKHFNIQKNTPSLNLLKSITHAFSQIPYENITKIIKKRDHNPSFRLPDELFEGFLAHETGGTCFSLTFFLYHLISQCGFIAYPIMAHRSYGTNTHCALVVIMENRRYLLDPGFLVDQPILMDSHVTVTTHTRFNILVLSPNQPTGNYTMATVQNGQQKERYQFEDDPVSWEGFEKHWHDSFNWSGLNQPVITKVVGDKQIYVRGKHARIVSKSGIERFDNDHFNDVLPRFFQEASLHSF
jgi:arylamine N-acetyltransferase